MTHQDIIDRMEALGRERGAAYKAEQSRIAKERDSLQELCGGLGHFYKKSDALRGLLDGRYCVFCGAGEPASTGAAANANAA